ncbi:hypothetical protein pEaSNUABM11_00212 [Erwinia phage pEa_SNUABM_11]|nr:hypothetical protein pEaSNUABM11_00212 [Erwinia phage pEa_SNUABM_11]
MRKLLTAFGWTLVMVFAIVAILVCALASLMWYLVPVVWVFPGRVIGWTGAESKPCLRKP